MAVTEAGLPPSPAASPTSAAPSPLIPAEAETTPGNAPAPPEPAPRAGGWRRLTRRAAKVSLSLIVFSAALVALIPTLLSTGPGREFALWWLNRRIAGHVEVADWSLGWMTGVRISGLTITDPGGLPALTADRIEAFDLNLPSLLSPHPHLGRVRASSFVLQSRVLDDGRSNLAAALSAAPKPAAPTTAHSGVKSAAVIPEEPGEPDFNLTFRLICEDGGLIRAQPSPGMETISVRLVRADIDVPALDQVSRYSLTAAAPRGDRPGTVDLQGTGRLLRGNRLDRDSLVMELTGRIDRLDLAVVSDVAASFGAPVAFGGTLDSVLSVRNTGPAPTADGTEIRVRDFFAFRPARPKAVLRLEEGLLDWQSRFRLLGLSVTDPAGLPAAGLARLSGVEVDLLSLVSSHVRLGKLVAEGVTVRSRWMPSGCNNLEAIAADARTGGLSEAAAAFASAPPRPHAGAAGLVSTAAAAPAAGVPDLGPLEVDASGSLQLDNGEFVAEGDGGAPTAFIRGIRLRVAVRSLAEPIPYSLHAAAFGADGAPAGEIDLSGSPLVFWEGRFNLDSLLGGLRGHIRNFDLAVASAVWRTFDPGGRMSGTANAEFDLGRGAGRSIPGEIVVSVNDLHMADATGELLADRHAELRLTFTADPQAGVSHIRRGSYTSGNLGVPVRFRNTTLSGLYWRVFTADGPDPFAALENADIGGSLADLLAYLNPALGNHAAPSGKVDLRVDKAAGVPLNRNITRRGELDLSLRFEDLRPAEGSLLAGLLAAAGYDWRELTARMDWQKVTLRDGRIHLGRQVWDLGGGRELVFTGDITLADKRLNVDVTIPVARPRATGGAPQTITVAVRGTVDHPEVDFAKAQSQLRELQRAAP